MNSRPNSFGSLGQVAMTKKRHRIPEVLRRAFGDRARTLGEAILYLSPKPPPKQGECLCRGRGCVGCGGSSFLLRQEDGPDYRQLLNRCFCVVSPGAPELTDLCYRREWTQRLVSDVVSETSHSFLNATRTEWLVPKEICLSGRFSHGRRELCFGFMFLFGCSRA